MFAGQTIKLHEEIATIAKCATLNAELRRLHSVRPGTLPSINPYENIPMPGRADWAVYDHCAGITRLYAIYERFVRDLVTAWLKLIPSLFATYSVLPDSLRKQHILGVARVLPRLGDRRYQHLATDQIIGGLYRGQMGGQEYELLYELFAITERNLRLDALVELFSRVAIPDIKTWLDYHHDLQSFMSTTCGGQETVDSKLNALVSYRNEAAHGEDVGQVIGLNDFLDLVAFIQTLCVAVAECAFHCVCECQVTNSSMITLGKVTEVFPIPRAVVAVLTNSETAVGQEVVIMNNTSCKQAKIISLQLNGAPIQTAVVTSPTELGIKFDFLPAKGSQMLALRPTLNEYIGAFI